MLTLLFSISNINNVFLMFLVISLVAQNLSSGSKWKTYPDVCTNKTGQAFFQCIENEAIFPLNEVIVQNQDQLNITSFYTNLNYGVSHSITLKHDVIAFEPQESLSLHFNKSLEFYLLFSDPNFLLTSPNPGTVPKTWLNIRSGKSLVYLKVTIIKDESKKRGWL